MADDNKLIFVIDDDYSVRRSIKLLLESRGYHIETFSSSEEFLKREVYDGIGCIILDINLEGKNGLELQEELLQNNYHLPIIFITGIGDIPTSVKAIKNGAVDFLQKPFDQEQLLEVVKEAIAKYTIEKSEFDELNRIRALLATLTEREAEVFQYVVSGMLNKQIAYELNIAEQTVKLHRGKITEKLGVKSVAELVLMAGKAGIHPSEN